MHPGVHVGTFMCILVELRLWDRNGTAASFCLSAEMFGNKFRELKLSSLGMVMPSSQVDRGTYECPFWVKLEVVRSSFGCLRASMRRSRSVQ